MTKEQKKILDSIVVSWRVEGMELSEDTKKMLIDILEGRISYQEAKDYVIAKALNK